MENKSDFANLNFEYETLHSFSKQGLNSVQYSLPKLNNLNSFFKTFVKYGDSLYNNTRKSVETLIIDFLDPKDEITLHLLKQQSEVLNNHFE